MIAWITLGTASILTLALRAGPTLISDRATMPKTLQRAQRFITAALMGALASRSVAHQVITSGGPAVLAAVAIAIPIALRTRSMLWTLTSGASTYLLVTTLVH